MCLMCFQLVALPPSGKKNSVNTALNTYTATWYYGKYHFQDENLYYWWRDSLPRPAKELWLYPVTAGSNFLLLEHWPDTGHVHQAVHGSPHVYSSTVTKESSVVERSIWKSERKFWYRRQGQDLLGEAMQSKAETKASAEEVRVSQQGRPCCHNCPMTNEWLRSQPVSRLSTHPTNTHLIYDAFSLDVVDHHDYASNQLQITLMISSSFTIINLILHCFFFFFACL